MKMSRKDFTVPPAALEPVVAILNAIAMPEFKPDIVRAMKNHVQYKNPDVFDGHLEGVTNINKDYVKELLGGIRAAEGFSPPALSSRTLLFYKQLAASRTVPLGRSRQGSTVYKLSPQGTATRGVTGIKIMYLNHVG